MRINAPISVRNIASTLLLLVALGAQAQTDTTRAQPNSTQAATTDRPQTPNGWIAFDDNVLRELNIPADRLPELRAVDTRYQGEYAALGNDPVTHPHYRLLTDRRNAAVRLILTPEQYGRWDRRYNAPTPVQPLTERVQPRPPGTTTPLETKP